MAQKFNENRKRAFLEDFKKNAAGEYVYTGNIYRFSGSEKERRTLLFRLCSGAAVMVVLWIVGGCIPVAGLVDCFYTVIPYFVGVLVGVVTVAWGVVRLLCAGKNVREYVYNATVKKLSGRLLGTSILSAVSFVCEGIYLVINGFGDLVATTVVYLCLLAVIACISAVLRHCFRRVNWQDVKNQ